MSAESMVTEIGAATLRHLGTEHLCRVGVDFSNEHKVADVYVALQDESRETQLHVLDHFADVQALLDEQDVELMIHLVSADSGIFDRSQVKELVVSR